MDGQPGLSDLHGQNPWDQQEGWRQAQTTLEGLTSPKTSNTENQASIVIIIMTFTYL